MMLVLTSVLPKDTGRTIRGLEAAISLFPEKKDGEIAAESENLLEWKEL